MEKKIMVITVAVLMAVMGLCVGCAIEPPPIKDSWTPSTLPKKHLIDGVPAYVQGYNECGPTSLQMVMNFYGKKLTKSEIVKSISMMSWGTPISEMERYAKSQGFGIYSFYGPKIEKMKQLIAQGYPLIALGEIPSSWYPGGRYAGSGHYVVVVGYDDDAQTFAINDPAVGFRMIVSYKAMKEFLSSMKFVSNCNYVLCIYPKEK